MDQTRVNISGLRMISLERAKERQLHLVDFLRGSYTVEGVEPNWGAEFIARRVMLDKIEIRAKKLMKRKEPPEYLSLRECPQSPRNDYQRRGCSQTYAFYARFFRRAT